jgi:sec-independent protein translocase protein TatA
MTLGFLGSLGTGEIILIVLLVILFFGARKIPELARSMGHGIREFKTAQKEVQKELEKESQDIKKSVED